MLQVLRPEPESREGSTSEIGRSIKSQAKFQTAARRESSEDSMKKAFLLIVVPALLVALGFAQTPTASINTDQTIKGCLAGSDGNYTVVEDNTGHTFKITTNSVDFKQHLGHDVTLIGRTTSGASSGAGDNSFAVTELNMISEHCAAAAAPAVTVGTSAETTVTPDAAAAVPVATSIATVAETAITPAVDAAAPAETVAAPAETASAPTAAAADPTRLPATSRRLSATPDPAAATPAAPVSTSSQTAVTPDAATTPAAPARHGALWLLIAFAVLVIVLGTLVPFFGRWRKQKMLKRTGAPNLSFTREASSDQDKPEQPRKVA
jgi:hypothetical protein